MKNKALALILSSLLAISFTSCSDSKSESAPTEQKPTETAAETAAETTTETVTETTTEKPTAPPIEYYDGLTYPDTMTDKEKENTSYREFTLTHFDKASKIGNNLSYDTTKVYESVKEMESNIREMRVYDEQLDKNFLVNVTLPPDYDENKVYPVFFITDAQYWFKCIPSMWGLIKDGKTAPVIFVSLGNDYDSDGANDQPRFEQFVLHRDEILDFINNDLMQLVSLNYKTDSSKSVFFGHSLGGLFADYALCNSDKYEEQPFANYIIASPALWTWYYTGPHNFDNSSISDREACNREFDYFERNENMSKNVFICAGGDEKYHFDEPDLKTIPEDAQSLYERLNSHGVNAQFKLYEGKEHMDYVEDMLNEYIRDNFPIEG